MTPHDLASQFDLYAEAAQQASNRAQAVENTHYHLGAVKAYGQCAHLVREFLVPRWAKDLPTTEGWFWHRLNPHQPPGLTYVYQNEGWRCNAAGIFGQLVAKAGGEWSGPICQPVDPVKLTPPRE